MSVRKLRRLMKRPSRRVKKTGKGLVNSIINKLPIELHLPGYQYCGPGTNLNKRLKRGDPGINELDKACKEHDIKYSKFKTTTDRHIADKILAEKAWQRAISKDSSLSERANAYLVTNAMKLKVKTGMGIKKGRKVSYRVAIKNAKKALKTKKPINFKDAVAVATRGAKIGIKGKHIKTPRIIPIPKKGGVLPFLVPLFAGLSAIGALSTGASSIAKAINATNQGKKDLIESKRHNKTMEAIALGKGLYLQPYKQGLGLFLKPHSKNL